MATVTSIPLGPAVDCLQDVVYALPARQHMVFAKGAVTISYAVDGVFVALTGANTVGAQCAGGFIKSAAANVVTCKA